MGMRLGYTMMTEQAGPKDLVRHVVGAEEVGFDFAVAEECGRYRECEEYAAVYGRRVVAVEYRAQDLAWTCAHHAGLAVVLRDLDVSPDGVRRWCPSSPGAS